MPLKNHYTEHPENRLMMDGVALIHFVTCSAAERLPGSGPQTQSIAQNALEFILAAFRCAKFPQADVLETKLMRGDRDDATLAMIKVALDSIGDDEARGKLLAEAVGGAPARLKAGGTQ